MNSDAKQKKSFLIKKLDVYFLQFKERKGYFNTLECLFCYSYYILHNTDCKTLHELYLY